MTKPQKTMEIKVERDIAAPPREVYAAWLNPRVPGTPWNMGDELILQAKRGGLFYWFVYGTPHYGRFLELKRPGLIRHTWMSPYTRGLESTVTVTFEKRGEETRMTLVHSGLPDDEGGRAHVGGWNEFMDAFPKHFLKAPRKKKAKKK